MCQLQAQGHAEVAALQTPLAHLEETAEVAFHAFTTYLKLYHPFLPFVTEKLWGELGCEGMLIGAPWPEVDATHDWPADAEGVDAVVRLVAAARSIRAEQGLEPGARIEVTRPMRRTPPMMTIPTRAAAMSPVQKGCTPNWLCIWSAMVFDWFMLPVPKEQTMHMVAKKTAMGFQPLPRPRSM